MKKLKNGWKKKIHTFPDGKRQTIQFKKGGTILDIRPRREGYVFENLDESGDKKYFKTKSQALSYAKNFMRRN